MRDFTLTITPAAADIDELGHVNNAVWVRWLQDVATAHWSAVASPDHVAAYVWVVTRHEIDYLGNVQAGETVTVGRGLIWWQIKDGRVEGIQLPTDTKLGGLSVVGFAETPRLALGSGTNFAFTVRMPQQFGAPTSDKPVRVSVGGVKALAAADEGFHFEVENAALGPIALHKLSLDYDGNRTWEIHADATSGYSTAILVQGGPATVTNNAKGILTGGYNGVYASSTTPVTFTNDGSITSVRGPAVEAAGGGRLVNTGTIQSGVDGMLISKAATVTNSGTIGSTGAGRAIAFSGADIHTLILGTGSVLGGNVQGGTGTDNLELTGAGSESIARFRNFETLAMQGTNWALTGAGAFTTSAAVEAGSLRVNGILTSPAVTVEQAGTLGGSGKIVGAVTNKGAIAAGDDGILISAEHSAHARRGRRCGLGHE